MLLQELKNVFELNLQPNTVPEGLRNIEFRNTKVPKMISSHDRDGIQISPKMRSWISTEKF